MIWLGYMRSFAFVSAALPTSRAFPIGISCGQGRGTLRAVEVMQPHGNFATTTPDCTDVPTVQALLDVQRRVKAASLACGDERRGLPKLVAVSKTKPVEQLMDVYKAGHRCFGENYVKEILEKAPKMPPDVLWHFIGHIQSNKVGQLIKGVPNLAVVETLDSLKLARKLNRALEASDPSGERRLSVFLQVDTSGEETKSGVSVSEAPQLARAVVAECPLLSVNGLMTIGAPGDSSCFERLASCRDAVAHALSKDPTSLELSMGMSNDFEDAIRYGASSVRVGSTIFGARDYSKRS